MIQIFYNKMLVCLILCVLLILGAISISAQTKAFTYQGRLTNNGAAANGTYDFKFQLYNTALNFPVGQPITITYVDVVNGSFTVSLDFTNSVDFRQTPNNKLALEIAVRSQYPPNGEFTTLAPRQPIDAAPFALSTLNSENAFNANYAQVANFAATCQTANSLSSGGASNFVQTNDFRLTNERSPSPGSANYIQNTTNQQANTNFNISGNGVIGGNFSVQGAISGNGSGLTNLNAANITTGTLNNAQIPNLDTGKITSGVFSDDRLPSNLVRLNAANNFTADQTFSGALNALNINVGNNLNVQGELSGNTLNSVGGYKIGGNRILSVASSNTFVGRLAGEMNTGSENTFVGFSAGRLNTTGISNSFFGESAGESTKTGIRNSFFGGSAGSGNIEGNNNSFFGYLAGQRTTGNSNSFFGESAGRNNQEGIGNTFAGSSSGGSNITGRFNSFFGSFAGSGNTGGDKNIFIGLSAGAANKTGNSNTVIGTDANVSADNLNFATAIGAGSTVISDNTIAFGRADGSDKIVIYGLGASGNTPLCRNALNQISTCTAFSGTSSESSSEINALREHINQQQRIIDQLKKIVCAANPSADICRQETK